MTNALSSAAPETFVVLDFETTGLDPRQAEILEVGAVRVRTSDLAIVERFESLVKPDGAIPPFITRLTGIGPEDVKGAPVWEEVRSRLVDFLGSGPIAAHNAMMEQSFLDAHAPGRGGEAGDWNIWDTLEPLTLALPELPSHSLENLRALAGLTAEGSHRALKDAEDTALLLKWIQDRLRGDRQRIASTVRDLQTGREEWHWGWLFVAAAPLESAPPEALAQLGDLRKLRAADQSREPEWESSVSADEVAAVLESGAAGAGLEFRPVQERMVREVAEALKEGGRVALEAPTGTGKSVAYLLPGVLAAEKTGAPLVVATHSKALQDQLLNKDVPAVARLLGREAGAQPAVRAAVVKGQNNYLCLRKFDEECAEMLSRDTSVAAWWPVAFLRALTTVERPVELDRVPRLLRERFPYLAELVERSRSHHTTTIGPTCPYYSRCHFFDSARIAHQSDVIIANHALVFQWPVNLPQIRNLVLDEAHHLEERVTEAFSVSVSGEEMAEAARRLDKRRGRGRDAGGDAESIARRVETVFKGDAAALLRNDAETLRTRITAVEAVLTVAFGAAAGRGGGGWGRADTLAMNPPGSAVAEAARSAVTEALSELRAAAAGLASRLSGWLKDIGEGRGGGEEDDHGLDLLKTHADAFSGFQSKLAVFLENTTTEHVRLLHRNPRDASWRLEVTPVDVSGLAGPFFEEKRAVVLTSATLTPGNSNPFILRRLGLDTSAGDSG
ncbi:MAG: hypothetical protein IT285_09705, partial [Bdellovibrionales bacterium]|nr:hypothetical protein [Bdellovibrionales bacterium]